MKTRPLTAARYYLKLRRIGRRWFWLPVKAHWSAYYRSHCIDPVSRALRGFSHQQGCAPLAALFRPVTDLVADKVEFKRARGAVTESTVIRLRWPEGGYWLQVWLRPDRQRQGRYYGSIAKWGRKPGQGDSPGWAGREDDSRPSRRAFVEFDPATGALTAWEPDCRLFHFRVKFAAGVRLDAAA